MPPRPTTRARARRAGAVAAAAAVLVAATAGCTAAPPGRAARSSSAPAVSTRPAAAGSASSRAATGAASSPAAPAPRTVTVLGSGDVLIHPPLWEQAAADAAAEGRTGWDFGPMYASIAPDVHRADVATCEMESPLAPPEGPFSGWPDFSSPPQVLTALKDVGYTSCTTASNHTLDQGQAGIDRTLAELDAAGLRHTGSARSAAEAATPLIETAANGARVAQLAYAFGFNGNTVPADRPWSANLTDVPTILDAAHRARAAGADVVVLSLHWGTEYQHEPTDEQRAQARALLASPDIDVILGDHVHVVQPFEQIDGKWVAYGMGNQISRHEDPIPASREGVMPRFTFTEVAPHQWRVTRAEAVPTWMQLAPALRLVDLPRALADPATTPADRAEFATARAQIAADLDTLGATAAGLVID